MTDSACEASSLYARCADVAQKKRWNVRKTPPKTSTGKLSYCVSQLASHASQQVPLKKYPPFMTAPNYKLDKITSAKWGCTIFTSILTITAQAPVKENMLKSISVLSGQLHHYQPPIYCTYRMFLYFYVNVWLQVVQAAFTEITWDLHNNATNAEMNQLL